MTLLPSLLLALASPHFGSTDILEQAQAALGSEIVQVVAVDDRQAQVGAPWRFSVEIEGETYSAWLMPTVVRAPGFRAMAHGDDGSWDCTVPSLGTWRGTLDGGSGAQVAVGRGPDGLRVAVLGSPTGDWFVQPLSSVVRDSGVAGGVHVAYQQPSPFEEGACGVDDAAPSRWVPDQNSAPESAGTCLSLAEIAFDVNHERYLYSSDVVLIQSEMDSYLNTVAAIHIRDFLVDYSLTHLEIRTTPGAPYVSDDPGTLLDAMRAEWTGNLASIPRDMAHLLVGQEMDTNVIGLAYVGVVCNFGFEYGLTQGNLGFGGVVSVLSHELGHNWNAPHCLDPAPCNQMCGGCNVFGPVTVNQIKNFVNNIGCLDDIPPPAANYAPFAAPDSFEGFGPMLLDVLANDHDANCEPLVISLPATSQAGGTLSILAGAGPNGRDLVSYSPALGFEGADSFNYVLTDSGGLNADANVTVIQRDEVPDLMGHYRMDNVANTDMLDSSSFGRDGLYRDGVTQGQAGAAAGTGNSVRLGGAPQRARHPDMDSPMGMLRENMTVAVWVRPEQLTGIQRYYGNLGTWSFGQEGDRLLFTTHGIRDYLSSPTLQVNEWQHVAAVFTPDHDVRFFHNGIYIGQVSGNQPSNPTPENGWFVGTLNNDSEFYTGSVDDLQVYDLALSNNQVAELYLAPGTVLDSDCAASNYCTATASSAGVPASIGYTGSLAVGDQDFNLYADGAPPGQFGLFFYGPGFVQTPAANGYICVSAPVRMAATPIDQLGFAQWQVDLSQPAPDGMPILGGSTWCFQFWFRDPTVGAGSNFSNGLVVHFCP